MGPDDPYMHLHPIECARKCSQCGFLHSRALQQLTVAAMVTLIQ